MSYEVTLITGDGTGPELAEAARVPAYVIFNDQTLRAIAKRQPGSRAALASISGIGPAKLERFGTEVLAVVAEHT